MMREWLTRFREAIVPNSVIVMMGGAVSVSPVFGQDESIFPEIARLNFQTYGDPKMVALGDEVALSRSNRGAGSTTVARYGAELALLAESVDLAAKHQEFVSFAGLKDLLKVVMHGQSLLKAGKKLKSDLKTQRIELESKNSDPVFLKRHDQAVEGLLNNHGMLAAILSRLEEDFQAADEDGKRENLNLLVEWFTTHPVEPQSRLSVSDDPQIQPVRKPMFRSIDRAELDLSPEGIPLPKKSKGLKDLPPPSGEPTAADLAVTLEAGRSIEVVALAASLDNSAVKIFNWVYRNIEFDAYVGSRRGSTETLRLRAGNDMDQASLLIDLLRAAGIPCRYARGMTEMTPEAVTNWLGTQSAVSAGSLLTTAGMEGITINNGPDVASVRCRRVWVEAYVPYSDYRGAGAGGGENLWVPLDPAFKKYENTFGRDLGTESGVDVDTLLSDYWSSDTPATVLEVFEAAIQPVLAGSDPPVSLAENALSRKIAAPELPWLPASLPNRLISLDDRFSEIAPVDRYKVRFYISGEGATLDHTVFLPEIAGKQVTLSYRGATAPDQALIAGNGGLDGISQPWLVKVLPELKVDGCVVATGTGAVTLGVRQSSQFFFTSPGVGATPEGISNVVVAGAYQGLAIGTGRILVESENRNLACPEDNAGEFQHKLGMRYLELNDQADRRSAASFQAVLWKGVSNAILGQQLTVLYSGNTPLTFSHSGLFVDADRAGATPFSAFGNDIFYRYGRIRGAQSSQNENLVFERYLGDDAVSTIRILRYAAEQGIPIYDIDSFNAASLIPQLTHPASTTNGIISQINSGRRVTVPRDPITFFEWSGTGYIHLETVNGTGGYIIAGGLSGGATAKKKKKPDCDAVLATEIDPPMPPGGFTNCDEGVVTITALIQTYNEKECEIVGTRVEEKKFSPSTLAPGIYPFKFGSAGPCGCGIETVNIKIKENDVSYKDSQGRPSIGGILEISEIGSEVVTAKSGKADTSWSAGNGITPTNATGAIVPFDVNIPNNVSGLPSALLPIPAVTYMIFVPDSGFIKPTNLVESCGSETIVTPFPNNTFELAFDITEIVKEKAGRRGTEANRSEKLGALKDIIDTATSLKEMSDTIGDLAEALGSPVSPPEFNISGKIFVKDQIKEVANSNRVEWTGTLGVAGEIGVSGDIPVGSTVAFGIPPQLANATIIVPVKAAFGVELSGDLTYRRPNSWPGVSVPKAEFTVGASVGIGVHASLVAGFAHLRATGTVSTQAKMPIVPNISGRNLKLQGTLEYEVKPLTLQYEVGAVWGLWTTSDTWDVFGPIQGPPGGAKPFTVLDLTPN